MSTKIIGLDAGHGLYTAGKQTPDGIKEWSLNDAVADRVTTILAEYDCKIIRTDNNEGVTDESLSTRVATYVNAGAQAFVSLHHNAYSSTWSTATGIEVYTDVNCTAEDRRLGSLIYNKMVAYTGLRGRGLKAQNFAVINQNTIPAVLVEGGFMDGTSDYKVITSEAGQDAYARAVAESLIEFLGLEKKSTLKPVDEVAKEIVDELEKAGYNAEEVLTKALEIAKKEDAAAPVPAPQPSPEPVEPAPAVSYFPRYTGTSNSIVTGLKAIGVNSSFANRTKIAKANGIKAYAGTANQNTTLVLLLKAGKLVRP